MSVSKGYPAFGKGIHMRGEHLAIVAAEKVRPIALSSTDIIRTFSCGLAAAKRNKKPEIRSRGAVISDFKGMCDAYFRIEAVGGQTALLFFKRNRKVDNDWRAVSFGKANDFKNGWTIWTIHI